MPKKNKRKFFGGKSNKSKSAKLDEENASKHDEENKQQEEEVTLRMQKSSAHASTQSVTNDSTIGQHELATLTDTNVTKMGGTMSCAPSPSMSSRTLRWCSEPNLNNTGNAFTVQTFRGASGNQIATIKLKVIQFIGEIPKETRDINSVSALDDVPNNHKKLEEIDEEEIDGNESMSNDNVENNQNKFKDEHESEKDDIGTMPKLDHLKEDEANEPQQPIKKRFDDNYRVESPKQISYSHIDAGVVDNSQNTRMTKRHAMLIQEISESSSSEEVKQFLDNEACAIESINTKIMKIEDYRVDSPASSDECNKIVSDVVPQPIIVQEIIESSSNESVKNEILDSMSKQPAQFECEPSITIVSCSNNTNIINIKELPSENNSDNNHNNNNDNNKILTTNGAIPTSPTASATTTKVKLFECKSEKKLNKAEEAIIEALYGNSNLLQIPNAPLDVISEEGSDCSDVERQNSTSKLHDIKSNDNNNNKIQPIDDYDEDEDDDVFLSTTVPNDAKYHRQRILQTLQKQRATKGILEQPQLINTKIIEAESNVQESCKSWETKQSDSELQAELVYLTSTSSSATDLSERSNNTDTEEIDEDTSEDTETNSLLENISVPSLYIDDVATANSININSRIQYQQLQSSDYYQEINEQQKLPDILEEEDEEQQARSILDIIESQQQIEDVNKELHHLVSSLGNDENNYERKRIDRKRSQSGSASENVCDETITVITCDHDKKLINEKEHDQNTTIKVDSKSGTPTPTQTRRKYSSDSSTSSSNSQCTIIRQIVSIDNVHPLKDLCMQSINDSNNTTKEYEGKVTIQKKLNSLSRNAPNIPIINELELHYECDNDDLPCRENVSKDKVITILQVPPDIHSSTNNNQSNNSGIMVDEKERWFGMQSSQMPNLMVALSPLQKDYMMNTHDSNSTTTTADVLLDMHKKFVERRAYHEEDVCRVVDDEINIKNSNEITRISSTDQLDDSNLSNSSSNNECALKSNRDGDGDKISDDNNLVDKPNTEIDTMNAIRNLILRESAAIRDDDDNNNNNVDGKEGFQVNKYELEYELRRLDYERKELEEELKNIQSLQHFKREEFLYQQKKLDDEERMKNESQTTIIESHSTSSSNDDSNNTNTNINKYVHDDFNDFINSNEKLHQEIYNEWQDKVYERTERKLHKMLKITTINDNNCDNLCSEPPLRPRERAASERIVPLNDEFLAKVKERQKRLSLPLDDNLDASTESLLNDDNETENGIMKKRKKKIFQADNKENYPAHFHEFIEYCEQEIVQSKNSVESGESLKKPLYLGLIGVALCICGFYIGKHFLTANSKFSP
ncbi:putative leucine-rich repeat-containing protein DDB_G0290503 isoform X2 [Chironomus tepperi]|uniref:putative leucine-rich repeat-containing protein DDB_G0290503 isoform X2 n=1 Tax=Chironomus tepperi TaxID=113505 RepID=UPI00391F51D9